MIHSSPVRSFFWRFSRRGDVGAFQHRRAIHRGRRAVTSDGSDSAPLALHLFGWHMRLCRSVIWSSCHPPAGYKLGILFVVRTIPTWAWCLIRSMYWAHDWADPYVHSGNRGDLGVDCRSRYSTRACTTPTRQFHWRMPNAGTKGPKLWSRRSRHCVT